MTRGKIWERKVGYNVEQPVKEKYEELVVESEWKKGWLDKNESN